MAVDLWARVGRWESWPSQAVDLKSSQRAATLEHKGAAERGVVPEQIVSKNVEAVSGLRPAFDFKMQGGTAAVTARHHSSNRQLVEKGSRVSMAMLKHPPGELILLRSE